MLIYHRPHKREHHESTSSTSSRLSAASETAHAEVDPGTPKKKGSPGTSRRTKKSTNKRKAVLYTLDPEVILLIERVAYHAGDAKSQVVNEVLRQELSKRHSSTIPTEWEQ